MQGYVGFAWNPEDMAADRLAQVARERLRQLGPAWNAIVDRPGVHVAHIPDPRARQSALSIEGSSDKAGATIGPIFSQADLSGPYAYRAISRFDRSASEEIERTEGRSMIRDYWGSYVLFLHDAKSRSTRVLRGPMSMLQCYWAKIERLHIFFSSVENLLALKLCELSINWDYIRAQAASPHHVNRETGFEQISALICGDCVEVRGGELTRRTYWDPRDIARSAETLDLSHAMTLLRNQCQLVVGSWASLHERVLVALSGGLDSSIVFGCLARTAPASGVTAVNLYARDSGDERRFARTMADLHGIPLIERERQHQTDLRIFRHCALTASPVLNYSAPDSEPALVRIARETRSTALLTGELGDNLFGQGVRYEGVAEYAWRHGWNNGLINVAMDYSMLRRVSIWRTLQGALRELKRYRSTEKFDMNRFMRQHHSEVERLISAACVKCHDANLVRFTHPWLDEAKGAPPGLLVLLFGLANITSTLYQRPFAGDDSSLYIHPLASQPLVEAALQIPAHLAFSGGQDRAVARRAFSDVLSEEVIQRGTAKGSTVTWVRDLVENNRAFVQEMLLDGELVRAQIVDRGKLATILSREVSSSGAYVADILELLYIEAWLQKAGAIGERMAA